MDAQLLELIKTQCRIDDLQSDREDLLLEHYYESALAAVLRETNRTEAELMEMGGGRLPADALQVILMLVDHQYENRSAGASTNQSLDFYIQGTLAKLTKLSDR